MVNTKRIFTETEQDHLKELFQSNITLREIGKAFKARDSVITRELLKIGHLNKLLQDTSKS